MTGKGSLHEQVSANLPALEANPQFTGARVWLTFYLCGKPFKLRPVAEALAEKGWRNTGDWEGAFLYPKLQVERTASAIVEVARLVQTLCEAHAVDILAIDADTSPDVRRSEFMTLFEAGS